MAKVTGIGGFFFRSRDPAALNRWYAEHLGVVMLESRWAITFRVDDVDGLVANLRAAGIAVEPHAETYPNGRFAELEDPEGNHIQPREPNEASVARDPGP